MRNITISILFTCAILLSACGGKKKDAEAKKEVTIAMVNWLECIADTHLAKVVLEEKGYKVNLINANVAPVFAAVAKGNADLFMEVWKPVTHKPYLDRFGDKLENVGIVYTEGKIGLVVPQYVPINSLAELNTIKDKVQGKIVGIDPGAGMMKLTQKAIEDYELDYELMASSEAGMLASLKRAYDKKEFIVFTGWKPHTKFTKYDLKILEDPKKIYGNAETIEIIATKGWSAKNPELATFFKNFKMTDEKLGSLMIAIEANPGKEDEAARKWYHENKAFVDAWFN
ncbi:glycine betaine ABC transporter substrate-binding protein [Puteibacter caeruleilacunae]|nr:glycine betaine ABC transporter substrate-binding protein [Puteibacter caeruleilacunae]